MEVVSRERGMMVKNGTYWWKVKDNSEMDRRARPVHKQELVRGFISCVITRDDSG